MSEENPDRTRRQVLKATAAAGAAAAASSVSAAADTGGWSVLSDETIDYTATPTEIVGSSGLVGTTDEPLAAERGDMLVERLASEGLLETASLDELPSGPVSETTAEGVYHITDGTVTNLGFSVQTDRGTLDVVFTETAPPVAALTTDGKQLLYGMRDGSYVEITREFDESPEIAADGSGTLNVTGCTVNSDCDPPCDCEMISCTGSTNRQIVCSSCVYGECKLTVGGCC